MLRTSIWQDGDYRALTTEAMLAYQMLLQQPEVTACGVLAFTPPKWTRMLRVDSALFIAELEEHRFVVVDPDTSELLIRSWVKHNVEGNDNFTAAAVRTFEMIESPALRIRLQEWYPAIFGAPVVAPIPAAPPAVNGAVPEPVSRSRDVMVRGTGSGSSEEIEREREPAEWELVWAHYQTYHRLSRLDAKGKRRKLILARLADGYSVAELCQSIDGNHLDPHCNGENESGTEYHDLELILRDSAHVERYGRIAAAGGPKRNGKPLRVDELVQWAKEGGTDERAAS